MDAWSRASHGRETGNRKRPAQGRLIVNGA
jgi:hypothetical protein